ncbi:hypothetical protein COZ55_02055 [archaeon CG_4_8_14_3_um_filter_38_5]|nr:MAG: hypothetical protein COS64_01100 [archaeon CG06_land_8_20_14_3_00_37_11]PIX42513.1 MAG: hypothetical protein COZ55_02055 [archaeon CG_4_8_14_3_um_filter_38_5]
MLDRLGYKIGFGILMIVLGIVLETYNVGGEDFLGFASVGNWLIYIGFLSIAVMILQSFEKKKRKTDERMYFVANKANRITFLVVIIASFAVIILDGISRITMPYSLFMSYFICGVLVAYLVSYWVLLKKY